MQFCSKGAGLKWRNTWWHVYTNNTRDVAILPIETVAWRLLGLISPNKLYVGSHKPWTVHCFYGILPHVKMHQFRSVIWLGVRFPVPWNGICIERWRDVKRLAAEGAGSQDYYLNWSIGVLKLSSAHMCITTVFRHIMQVNFCGV